MTEPVYAQASGIPDNLPETHEYNKAYFHTVAKLATPENIKTAETLQTRYMCDQNFVYRDGPDRLLMFRTPPPGIIRAGGSGLVLPDGGDLFPELETGEYIGLGSFLAMAQVTSVITTAFAK